METKKMYDRLNEKLSFVSKPLSKCFMLVLNLSAIIAAIVAVVDYFNPDPFEKLSKQLLDYQDEVASLKMVEIPDSLMTDEIRDIRSNQQKVLANAIMINSFSPINVKDKDINVVKQELELLELSIVATKNINDILLQTLVKSALLDLERGTTKMTNLSNLFYPSLTNRVGGDKYSAELNIVIGKIKKCKQNDINSIINIANEFINSDFLRDYFKNENLFVRKLFDYMNVMQLCIAYDIEISKSSDDFSKSDKLGGSNKINSQIIDKNKLISK